MRKVVRGGFCALLAAALLALPACASRPHRDRIRSDRGYLETSRHWLEACLEHDALVRVKPWERELLSRNDMATEPDSLHGLRRSHIYFSKEASLVGGGAGGGGCGCN